MNIANTYSSWTRNRLTPAVRAEIREAGEGTVDFMAAVGKPAGWVGCRITTPEGDVKVGVGADPRAAFIAANAHPATLRVIR